MLESNNTYLKVLLGDGNTFLHTLIIHFLGISLGNKGTNISVVGTDEILVKNTVVVFIY